MTTRDCERAKGAREVKVVAIGAVAEFIATHELLPVLLELAMYVGHAQREEK